MKREKLKRRPRRRGRRPWRPTPDDRAVLLPRRSIEFLRRGPTDPADSRGTGKLSVALSSENRAPIERALAQLEFYSANPRETWNEVLPEGERPRDWQGDASDDLRNPENRRIAIIGCREASKSRFLAMAGTHHLCFNPGSLVLQVAPTGSAATGLLLEEIPRILWERSPILRQLFPAWNVYADRIDTGVPGWRMESVAFGHRGEPRGLPLTQHPSPDRRVGEHLGRNLELPPKASTPRGWSLSAPPATTPDGSPRPSGGSPGSRDVKRRIDGARHPAPRVRRDP